MADSMYQVIEEHVRLHRGELEMTAVGAGDPSGTWALFIAGHEVHPAISDHLMPQGLRGPAEEPGRDPQDLRLRASVRTDDLQPLTGAAAAASEAPP